MTKDQVECWLSVLSFLESTDLTTGEKVFAQIAYQAFNELRYRIDLEQRTEPPPTCKK